MVTMLLKWLKSNAMWGKQEKHAEPKAEPVNRTSIPVGKLVNGCFIDSVQIDPVGLVALIGWSVTDFDAEQQPEIYANGKRLPLHQSYRYPRGDVGNELSNCWQTGLKLEYLIPDELFGKSAEISARWNSEQVQLGTHSFISAHYRSLLISEVVHHREQIYGVGPPNRSIHPDIVALARTLPGPVLDFGCGAGALMKELIASGVEVRGLEKGADVHKRSLLPELKDLVHYYDGRFPVSFKDGEFESVVCSEVLEHIPDFQTAVKEIARVTADRALFTVPDAAAIALGFRHGSVPWHLMEASHVNFFSQRSLHTTLAPHFKQIEFGRIGAVSFNDTPYFVSLVALCRKR